MFKNYYLFKKQIDEISLQIKSAIIFSIYTVHKNELIIDLKLRDEVFQLQISVDPTRPYIFLSEPVNYKLSRYNLFEMLYGQEILSLYIIPNNKYLIIDFNYHRIGAYFFGPKPNIIVLDIKDDLFITSFKLLKKNDLFEKPNLHEVKNNSFESEFSTAIKSMNGTLKELVKNVTPSASNKMVNEIAKRMKLEIDSNIKPELKDALSNEIKEFYTSIESGNAYIYRKDHHEMHLLLYKSKQLEDDGFECEEFKSINKAWKIFNHQRQKALISDKLFNQVIGAITKRKRSLEIALEKLKEAENIEQRKILSDLTGNLILTNKHKIPRGAASIEVINIFSDEQETINIKLNPKKTAVENATYYFEKYKNVSEKKQVLKIKKDAHLIELEEISYLNELTESASIKDLIKIKNRLINMNILQSEQSKPKDPESLKYSFKRIILEGKWDVYIGKNSLNNDLLTFSFAKKSDLWLHAQGVSGSHVVIKVPKDSASVPKAIIEQAAQIAASNSKAQHSSTVPVIYTEIRYVNKIKKAPPGTVNVRNEKVIFVKPLNLN